MCQKLPTLLPAHPLDQKLDLTFLAPLWSLGIVSLESLSETRHGQAYMLPSSCLDIFGSARKLRDIRHAKVSLNRLTLLLSGTCYQLAMKHTGTAPLPPSATSNQHPGDQFRITAQHAFIQLPQPSHSQSLRDLSSYKFQYYNYSAVQSSLHSLQNLPGPLPLPNKLKRTLPPLPCFSHHEQEILCPTSPTLRIAFHTQHLHAYALS